MYFCILANKWGNELVWKGQKLFCTNGRSYQNIRGFWKLYELETGAYVIHDVINAKNYRPR